MNPKLLHLPLRREQPQNTRRARGGGGGQRPDDPIAHGRRLSDELDAATSAPVGPAYDDRALLKLRVASGVNASDFAAALSGVEVVSQEGKEVVLLFASEEGLVQFRSRLDMLARAGHPTRQDLLFAIQGFENWSHDNRRGRALQNEGEPVTPSFLIDVELWPLESLSSRRTMVSAFTAWCQESAIEILDTLDTNAVVLRRCRVTKAQLALLLDHRDVRTADLPPVYQLSTELVRMPVSDVPPISAPPDDAPGIALLDSGLAAAHPLLSAAVGDAQSFLRALGPDDENGHGTLVAGLCLYGDVTTAAERKEFVPVLRLFSGRITDANAESPTRFVEKAIAQAVEYFKSTYGCKVFNLSFGDQRRVYRGGHVGSLAAVLDELSREHAVLFVVSAGNFQGVDGIPHNWWTEYPTYLKSDEAGLIDPAPALNALTVGSLARFERDRVAARHPKDPAYQPIARADEPSPFTRTGPGPNGAIKPELVEYGGNWSTDIRLGRVNHTGDLGELSMAVGFVGGNLFGRGNGTSFASPKVAHLAARLLADYPHASANLLRALLVLHAERPDAAGKRISAEDLLRFVGYGRPRTGPTVFCSESCVTMYAEENIGENAYHFYEVPIPEDFLAPPVTRPRCIRVALAHTPAVRRTRIDYRMSAMSFRVVRHASLEDVVSTFQRARRDEQPDIMKEAGEFRPSSQARSKGTVQAATWEISRTADVHWGGKRLFVVVERAVPAWAHGSIQSEPYALTVSLEDKSEQRVRLYSQLRVKLGARVRV